MTTATRWRSASIAAACGAGLLSLLAGCGAGGGGSQPKESVHFLGFSFQVGSNAPTAIPPLENLQAVPPTLGGPLDIRVIFTFDGVPQGPFTQQNLPVFTTPADCTPLAFPPAGVSVIPAKGSYVPVGSTVEFRPFIPIKPLAISLSSPPEAVPGLLPGSVYTAQVISSPGSKISNLVGDGGSIQFGTTSNEAAYFSSGGDDGKPPVVVESDPPEGTTGVSPHPYSQFAPGSALPTFPSGPSKFTLSFDHALRPTAENLDGTDLDGDGAAEPSFFIRAQATRLLVAHTVPAVSSVGSFTAPFPALSGLSAGEAVPPTGTDIFLHNSQGAGAFPGGDPALVATPGSMAVGTDSSLLFVVLKVDAGNDKLTVIDGVLGDPSHALIASAPATDTLLDDLVGITTLLDGRLVGYDRTTRRLYELLPAVVRDRAGPGHPIPGPPVLTSLALGTGAPGGGFRSEVFPAGTDVIDLAQSPSGVLYALADTGATFPSIVRLNPIDFDLDDAFDATDGLFESGASILALTADYAAIECTSDDELLALNRTDDSIDIISLTAGKIGVAVSDVAAFGLPLAALPGGLSPATAMTLGYMSLDVDRTIESNDPVTGAIVHLTPAGVLPLDADIELRQRNNLQSLTGVSAANADPNDLLYVLGSQRIVGVHTSAPVNTVGPCGVTDPGGRVTDVFTEEFVDQTFQDGNPPTLSPLAEWAKPLNGAITSGNLRASVGLAQTAELGDFVPLPNSDFDPLAAYSPIAGVPATAHMKVIVLDTDAQNFPLLGGVTPGITTPSIVFGGQFSFRDFIIPEGVTVVAHGSNPLVITATRKVEIRGVLDVSGADSLGDNTFDSAFTPSPGGIGGAGAGRGGNGHPTVYRPNFPQTPDQYASPASGERGYGPIVGPTGAVTFDTIGGFGGLSTLGYTPDALGYPSLPQNPAGGPFGTVANNTEHARPPGGGGGSYAFHGMWSHIGTGAYRVEANAVPSGPTAGTLVNAFFPNFKLCPSQKTGNPNYGITDAIYGNEQNKVLGLIPDWPLQCVYMQGTPASHEWFQPPALPGNLLFTDGDPTNDFFGDGGEHQVLVGGQGGGGGGSRLDGLIMLNWAATPTGGPFATFPPYPPLFYNFFVSATVYDAKGGGGGGGGGAVQIRSYADILITKTGHIDASGGDGNGGETITASNYAGGGGGGSGGAILLQAAGKVRIEADDEHVTPYFMDISGSQGASLDVSGGFGCDAVTNPQNIPSQFPGFNFEFTRSDGGQGGFGLIQLQEGGIAGAPVVQQGAFLFARQRATLKLGQWTAESLLDPFSDGSKQKEHPSWPGTPPLNPPPPNILRYIDMLDYRYFTYDLAPTAPRSMFYVLNGSDPPVITVTNPDTVGPFQLDTPMIDYFGKRVVKEPQPHKVMKTYAGWDANFKELNNPPDVGPPGTLYEESDSIPFSIYLKEPDGTPRKEIIDGQEQFDPDVLVDRLPVVHPGKTPPPLGTVSRGTSRWLDFNGAALRARNALGVPPPLFTTGVNGTYNALQGLVPPGKDGLVITVNAGNTQAHLVKNTGPAPFDPGLCTGGTGVVPLNDIKVDAPDIDSPLENAISDNATVMLKFQGAFPVRAGSHVPDPATLTNWVSDLRDLSGYPLVRFQVTFDLSNDVTKYPFGPDSFRPAVDRVRVRAQY